MPKAFSDREKEIIRARLLEKGSEIFATYGIRKTSIDNLAAAAGISKGAFYLFYESKEDLYLEITDLFEVNYRQRMLSILNQPGQSPRQALKTTLQSAMLEWKTNPLFRLFNREEYEYLLRKISPERLAQKTGDDDDFAVVLLNQLKQMGVPIQADPLQVSNLFKALFVINLHENDFAPIPINETLDLLIDLILDYVFGKESL